MHRGLVTRPSFQLSHEESRRLILHSHCSTRRQLFAYHQKRVLQQHECPASQERREHLYHLGQSSLSPQQSKIENALPLNLYYKQSPRKYFHVQAIMVIFFNNIAEFTSSEPVPTIV